jgi:hypothetical protein
MVKPAQTLHGLQRLREYSHALTAKVVSHLVILLNCRVEPAFLNNLEAPLLRFIDPT